MTNLDVELTTDNPSYDDAISLRFIDTITKRVFHSIVLSRDELKLMQEQVEGFIENGHFKKADYTQTRGGQGR